MRKKIFLLLFYSMSIMMTAQQFEGKIVYISKFYPSYQIGNNPKLNDTIYLYVKKDKFKIIHSILSDSYNLKLGRKYYYISSKYEIINFDINSDSIFNLNNDLIRKITETKKKEKILKHRCKQFILTEEDNNKKVITDLWVNESYKVNNTFSKYIIKDIGVVFKFISNYKSGKRIVTATEILPTKLNDSIFELPDYPIKEVDFEKLSKQYIKEY